MADPFTELASEVVRNPQVLTELTEWFDSDKARSAFQFGIALGKVDEANTAAAFVRSWIDAGRCPGVVAGYLRGRADQLHGLPPEWTLHLDENAKLHPQYVALVSMEGDPSLQGFQRVFVLIKNDLLPLKFLRGFGWGPWLDVLRVEDQAAIIALLAERCEREPAETVSIALGVLASWSWKTLPKKELPTELIESALALLRLPMQRQMHVDHHNWTSVLELVAEARPTESVELILDALTIWWPGRIALENEALPLLLAYAAQEPHYAMEAIGRRLLDPERRPWFSLLRLPGLFEAIGVEVVKNWINLNGREYMQYIAPHLEGPKMQDGKPIIPPVTEWALTEFEDDDVFRAFCSGQHNGEVLVGDARDRRPELERVVEPFRNHPLRRVRDWVQYELQSNDREAEMDEYLDEQHARI